MSTAVRPAPALNEVLVHAGEGGEKVVAGGCRIDCDATQTVTVSRFANAGPDLVYGYMRADTFFCGQDETRRSVIKATVLSESHVTVAHLSGTAFSSATSCSCLLLSPRGPAVDPGSSMT
jgi:hypothetical protein